MSDRTKDGESRLTRDEEIPQVAALAREARNEALEYRGGARWIATDAATEPLEDYVTALMADSQAVVMSGIWDGTVVGYGWARRLVRQDGSPIIRIEELFVTPKARSVGVGESLFGALKQWAQEQGAEAIDAFVLPGHREAKNFFETFKMTAHALIVHTKVEKRSDS